MKIEYLPNGSPDCPLIRICDFDVTESAILLHAVQNLAKGLSDSVSLNELNGIIPIDECNLILKQSLSDQGVLKIEDSKNVFMCLLTKDSWEDITGLVELFCQSDSTGYQWLDNTSNISLLLSVDGSW